MRITVVWVALLCGFVGCSYRADNDVTLVNDSDPASGGQANAHGGVASAGGAPANAGDHSAAGTLAGSAPQSVGGGQTEAETAGTPGAPAEAGAAGTPRAPETGGTAALGGIAGDAAHAGDTAHAGEAAHAGDAVGGFGGNASGGFGGEPVAVSPCPFTTCGTVCADLRFDHDHCGRCDEACGQHEVCSNGDCAAWCLGSTQCGNTCIDDRFDPKNCGGCGIECDAGEVCTDRACDVACGLGTERCGSRCADTQLDPKNCGTCGKRCAEGQVCSAGVCRSTCLSSTLCAGRCVDTKLDPANCGSCGAACNLPEAQAACADGACRVLSCQNGFVDLDKDPTNGCECQKSDEKCDGKDNDCDGLIDFATENNVAVSKCLCGATRFVPSRETTYPGPNQCDTPGLPECHRPGDGSIVLSACQECVEPWPWTTCVFADGLDLTLFDASYTGKGWIEVSFCTEGLSNAAAYLWYGVDPKRRRLKLSSVGDADHCDTLYFAPDAACFSSFAGLDPTCMNKCGKAQQSCAPFASTELSLTIEGCAPGTTVNGTLTVKSATYLDDACRCRDSSTCKTADRKECRDTRLSGTRVCTP